jgi:hypothetical protein
MQLVDAECPLPLRPSATKVDLVVSLGDEEALVLADDVLLDQSNARPSRRERRAQRRRLRHLDALSARLAELHAIRDLLERAASVVAAGWVKGAWFTVATATGDRPVAAHDLDLLVDRHVTGACLVGGVVQAAGGPATVRSQLVQRTLDLTWHALREDPSQPVRWCPGPRVRSMHVLELTYWNDAPERTRTDVLRLLRSAQMTAEVQLHRCRAEQAVLTAS